MPAPISEERIRLLAQLIQDHKTKKNGQIVTDWDKVNLNKIHVKLFQQKCVLLTGSAVLSSRQMVRH